VLPIGVQRDLQSIMEENSDQMFNLVQRRDRTSTRLNSMPPPAYMPPSPLPRPQRNPRQRSVDLPPIEPMIANQEEDPKLRVTAIGNSAFARHTEKDTDQCWDSMCKMHPSWTIQRTRPRANVLCTNCPSATEW
jgi:hypothetical protein